jgi:hypothetical protein
MQPAVILHEVSSRLLAPKDRPPLRLPPNCIDTTAVEWVSGRSWQAGEVLAVRQGRPRMRPLAPGPSPADLIGRTGDRLAKPWSRSWPSRRVRTRPDPQIPNRSCPHSAETTSRL